jgi:hypothetical protein
MSCSRNKSYAGAILSLYLRKRKITATEGCGCKKLALEMNRTSESEIRKNIDYWDEQVKTSAKAWTKQNNGIITLLYPLIQHKIKGLILWACDESELRKQEKLNAVNS